MTDVDRALERVVAAPTLLVASDFDGTLSPIVDDPSVAAPLESATAALARLADLPDTHVAVVSGRALADLRVRARVPAGVHLIGGHGTEIGSLPGLRLSTRQSALRDRIERALAELAATAAGFLVEPKPGSVAFHYRNADPADAARALDVVHNLAAGIDGVTLKEGKMVVELAVTEGDKGTAILRLARSLGAHATLYVGDDLTDEDAFAALGPADLGIKVGDGPTRAECRVDDPAAVAALLHRVLALRAARVA